jgi:hypothetical protein
LNGEIYGWTFENYYPILFPPAVLAPTVAVLLRFAKYDNWWFFDY